MGGGDALAVEVDGNIGVDAEIATSAHRSCSLRREAAFKNFLILMTSSSLAALANSSMRLSTWTRISVGWLTCALYLGSFRRLSTKYLSCTSAIPCGPLDVPAAPTSLRERGGGPVSTDTWCYASVQREASLDPNGRASIGAPATPGLHAFNAWSGWFEAITSSPSGW